jgi:hypothetical protein
MAKPSITTRTAKGSPLTIAEMDSNLTNLQSGGIRIGTPSSRTQYYPSGMYQTSDVQKKFGERSLSFNGTSNSFQLYYMPPGGMGPSTSPWDMGMGAFSAEQFVWIDSTGTGERAIFDTRSGPMGMTNNGLYVYIDSTGLLKAKRGTTEIATSATALATDTWLHIAIERFTYGAGSYSAGVYLLVNGVVAGSWINSMDMFDNASQIRYGEDFNSSNRFKGYMDEMRWTQSQSRYMPSMPPYTTIAPVPTAELSNDGYTAYLFHFNESSMPQDDINQTFNLELGNDTFSIQRQSPITLSLDASSKRVTVGIDTGAISIPVFVAVQYANSFNHNGTRQSRIDFGYNEVIDQQSFVNGQGNGIFQIQNNSTNPQNYLIELYGNATTAATGSIELYNHSNNFSTGMTFPIVGGVIASGAWQVNLMSNNSTEFSIGLATGTGSETFTGGNMFLKITRV